jgi:Retrotransposon gag protein
MGFMKYLALYTGNEDAKNWLDNYELAADSEGWHEAQMLGFVKFKLHKYARDWFHNFFIVNVIHNVPKINQWEQFATLFLHEFHEEDLNGFLAKCQAITQRDNEPLHEYLLRYQSYFTCHDNIQSRLKGKLKSSILNYYLVIPLSEMILT